ncbi:MAG: tetratricopeptide repeat protein [Phycisphaerae bacterium]|nr:tetratricopeptide repeat protein [Phycisphaerae bacterium]
MRINIKVVFIFVFVLLALPIVGCDEMAFKWNWPTRDNSEELCARGLELMNDGNSAAALEELSKAVETDPENSTALTAIGDIHRKDGNYELARINYESACDVDSYSFRPHYNLGVTYQALAKLSQSIEEMQQHITRAVNVYIRALAIKPESFDTHLNLGVCYYQLGQPDLAEQQIRHALILNPHSRYANNNLAVICESQNRLPEAIEAYKNSLEADSDQPKIMMKLARAYTKTGHLRAGLWTYRAVTKKAPKSSAPWCQIGICYFRMKQLDDSLRAFQQAIRLNPESHEAYRGYGVVCMYQYVKHLDRTDLQGKGLLAWEYSLRIKPDQPDLVKLMQRYSNGGKSGSPTRTVKTRPAKVQQISRR